MMLLLVVLVAIVLAVTLAAVTTLLWLCVDHSRLRMPLDRREEFTDRLLAVAPYIGALGLVLVINKGLQNYIQYVSDVYGFEATELFYRIEGDFVSAFQQLFPEGAVFFFSPMYIFGYVVLLVFPLVAYLFADSLKPLQTLIAAYAVNYAIAVIFYAGVYAYGPRNHSADSSEAASVSEPMFDLFPDITVLTAQVNVHTNVFPSLHTALSVTVLLVAISTYDEFPRWTAIASVIAVSIVFSTMYLGIHWLVDVVAGILLAATSVTLARRLVDRLHARQSGTPFGALWRR